MQGMAPVPHSLQICTSGDDLLPEQMDGKRFKYISAISLLTVWGALGPWLERTGACWLVQQAP